MFWKIVPAEVTTNEKCSQPNSCVRMVVCYLHSLNPGNERQNYKTIVKSTPGVNFVPTVSLTGQVGEIPGDEVGLG